jgi:hypothetical protein
MLTAKRVLIVIAIVFCLMQILDLFVQVIRPKNEAQQSPFSLVHRRASRSRGSGGPGKKPALASSLLRHRRILRHAHRVQWGRPHGHRRDICLADRWRRRRLRQRRVPRAAIWPEPCDLCYPGHSLCPSFSACRAGRCSSAFDCVKDLACASHFWYKNS